VGKVNVTIMDVTGNKEQQATLPDDAPVRRIIAKLVQMMNLPTTSPDGQPMNYKFHHKASGKQLAEDMTLSQAEVRDGDVLRLQPEITAGSSA
jgi:uncharacterized ubiquitin-like protein YukD